MSATLIEADARSLAMLPDEFVQTVITSPPYFGLRDYGTARWEGGDPACDHRQQLGGEGQVERKAKYQCRNADVHQYRGVCQKCGAARVDAQIGLEPSPDAYVQTLVQVFREVRRVLKDNGVLFLNLGDSYYNCSPVRTSSTGAFEKTWNPANAKRAGGLRRYPDVDDGSGLKMKDLIGIPWRVAFALQADGWYLRSDIIWAKPNPMPESVTDRPTKAHEYLFLLTKSSSYYYDAQAVAEPVSDNMAWRAARGHTRGANGKLDRSRGDAATLRGESAKVILSGTRNRRTVWTVNTQPYKGAHFATFPEALVELCVLAGSKRGDLVLDPFCGSGTVGAVCEKHGRDFIGLDINPAYIELAKARIEKAGGFVSCLRGQQQQQPAVQEGVQIP